MLLPHMFNVGKDNTGVTDRVVNQLLTLIDGADATMGGINGDSDSDDENDDENDGIGQGQGQGQGHERSSNQVNINPTSFPFFWTLLTSNIIRYV